MRTDGHGINGHVHMQRGVAILKSYDGLVRMGVHGMKEHVHGRYAVDIFTY